MERIAESVRQLDDQRDEQREGAGDQGGVDGGAPPAAIDPERHQHPTDCETENDVHDAHRGHEIRDVA